MHCFMHKTYPTKCTLPTILCIKHTARHSIIMGMYMHTPCHAIAPREAFHDCILKMFVLTFLHAKAEVLIYLYIFHTAGKECPVSDVSLQSRHSLLTPGCTDFGRRQRQPSNMKHPGRASQPPCHEAGKGPGEKEG